MNVTDLELPGLKLVEPKVFGDARGLFLETWNQARYAAAGIAGPLVQDNL
jgi:dTDP-4-dehydrorhamnose 3,5-epimerase